jgi:aerobic-type carbon monoxide dehydrogenase small subunit (CoxS/CutS family)
MSQKVTLNVNGQSHSIDADPDMPLLYALRNDVGLNNPHFGCGLAQCGACTVHVDGQPTRSCVTPLSAVGNAKIVTLAGLGTPEKPHPLQTAYVEEQVPQCGYCINGWLNRRRLPARQKEAERSGDQGRAVRIEVPLRHTHQHSQGAQARR